MKQLEKLSGCPDSEHDLGLFLNSERDILVKSGPMTEKISCMLQLAKLNRALVNVQIKEKNTIILSP